MTRQFWRARLRLSGDNEVDKANRERMLDVLHESLQRARASNREALARGSIRIGEVSVGEAVSDYGKDIDWDSVRYAQSEEHGTTAICMVCSTGDPQRIQRIVMDHPGLEGTPVYWLACGHWVAYTGSTPVVDRTKRLDLVVGEPMREKDETTCPVNGCGADGRGTINGSKPMLCGGYGHWDPRCMGNWAATDPEDREPYEVYLREIEQGEHDDGEDERNG